MAHESTDKFTHKLARHIKRRRVDQATVVGLALLVLLPLLPLFLWAFSGRWLFPAILPTEWGLRAWHYLLTPGARVAEAFTNSMVIALAVTLLALPIALPAGRALGLHHFRGKTLVEFLILAPTVVPPFAAAMGIQILFIRAGLADTLAGVILVHLVPTVPYAVLVLAGAFARYDVNYEQQARVLGANGRQILWRVTLPALRPALVVAGLFTFLISWSQYLLTLLIGGGDVLTLPVLLLAFAGSGDYAITAALSLLLIAPALIALLLSTRALTGHDTALRGV
jgi:putative spermidine/putrescine transport system permease protein